MSRKIFQFSVVVVIVAISVAAMLIAPRKGNMFHGDVNGYYLYLPVYFIYHNADSMDKFPRDRGIPPEMHGRFAAMRENYPVTSSGVLINQYTYAVALMELPFFLVVHAYEKMSGLPANGFSDNYYNGLLASSVFYTLLGLLILYHVLRRYYNPEKSLLAITLIYLGTNLFWFTLFQPGMSHVPLFFLYSLLIGLAIKVHEHPRWTFFAAIGLVIGLITVMRPTDIVCALIPLLYNVYNKETFREKLRFLNAHKAKLFLLILAASIPAIPQMIYWKMQTGKFIYYSYGQQSFEWLRPKIVEGLFYFNNGWLAYTPIMIFALLGLLLYKYYKQWAWSIWIILPIYIYVVYSWYCYNYINGFGSRPMIHMYPLLLLPFTALIHYISNKGLTLRSTFAAICLFFVALNLSASIQQRKALLRSEESNFWFNAQMLFKGKMNYDDLVVNDNAVPQPDQSRLMKIATVSCLSLDDSSSTGYLPDTARQQGYVYHLGTDEYPPFAISVPYNKALHGKGTWLKASGRFMYLRPPAYWKHLLIVEIRRNEEFLLWKGIKIENKIGTEGVPDLNLDHHAINRWGVVHQFIQIPNDIKDGDKMRVLVWNTSKQDLFIDDLCLELYREK